MTDLVKNLKKDILESGLPTEIQVTNLLRRDDWIVINQYPYVDPRSQETRTLDITAGKLFKNGRLCVLYIECKKSVDNQWVFYTSGGSDEGFSFVLRLLEGVIQHALESKKKGLEGKGLPFSFHSYLPNQSIGLISYIPFGKKDDFHEARSQLISAIESRRLAPHENLVMFPVIVFNGDIYDVQPKADDIALCKTDYIVFLSTLISETTPILIDVVTLNSFSNYLERLNEELGPSYSYTELLKWIENGVKIFQDFAQLLANASSELKKINNEAT